MPILSHCRRSLHKSAYLILLYAGFLGYGLGVLVGCFICQKLPEAFMLGLLWIPAGLFAGIIHVVWKRWRR